MSKNNLRSPAMQNIFLLVSRQNMLQKHSSLQLMTRPGLQNALEAYIK